MYLQRYLVQRETAAVSVHVLCTPYNNEPLYGVASFEDTYVVACMCVLVVTVLRRCYCGNAGVERTPK